MGNTKNREREIAKELFLQGGKTQKEIADMVGVTEKTVGKWVEDQKWGILRTARLSTPTEVLNTIMEIHRLRTEEILEEVRAGKGSKYGDELLKMSMAIEKLQGHTSLSTYIHVLSEFMLYVGGKDHKFRAQLADYQSTFLNSKAGTNG